MSSTGFYDVNGREITRAAFFALKAATMARSIGRYAAMQFALKNGSSLRLFCLAQQLIAANKFDATGKI